MFRCMLRNTYRGFGIFMVSLQAEVACTSQSTLTTFCSFSTCTRLTRAPSLFPSFLGCHYYYGLICEFPKGILINDKAVGFAISDSSYPISKVLYISLGYLPIRSGNNRVPQPYPSSTHIGGGYEASPGYTQGTILPFRPTPTCTDLAPTASPTT